MSQRDFDGEPNLRSERYFIAHAKLRCGSCRAETGVVAVGLPAGHESLVSDWPDERPAEHDEPVGLGDGTAEFVGQGDVGDGSGEAIWENADGAAFLFHLDALPASVLHRLAGTSPGYRRAVAESMRYYANHCETCGAMFEDEELFCEPGGAFSPTTEADAGAVALTVVDEPIQARAGGYAIAPQFFELIVTV
jgi:hypothetical protein